MWYNGDMKNDLRLSFRDGNEWHLSHFRMAEFQNRAGYVMIDDSVIRSLEKVREDLGKQYECEVEVIVTSGIRTLAENERLAELLGWTDEGGLVARDSQHLEEYGGIAVDIRARFMDGDNWVRVVQGRVGDACRDHFVYVKADYLDGHVHADNRKI